MCVLELWVWFGLVVCIIWQKKLPYRSWGDVCLRQGFSLQVDWWCNISNENMDLLFI
jgi:hypothetical protein